MSAAQRIVLVGGGHGHVQVIKALNKHARPRHVSVTLVDVQASASYSGMVPGCVSKLYTPEETLIHLAPLAKWADIDFVHQAVADIDVDAKHIILADGAVLPFDVVSVDIGSASRGLDETRGAKEHTIPTRPISDLVRRISDAEESLKAEGCPPAHVAVVGGGAAGIELALAMRARWGPLYTADPAQLRVTLLDSGSELLPHETAPCKAALNAALAARRIDVLHHRVVKEVAPDRIHFECDADPLPYTHCIWATGAVAHPLALTLKARGLAVTERGWLRVNPSLQSVSHPCVFAAGDCASIENLPDGKPSPTKAGVYAVRSGPVLIDNLPAFIAGEALRDYAPQDDFLKLLMCGDGQALGFRFGVPLGPAKWVWEMKDAIDTMFMALFMEQNLPVLEDGADVDRSQFDAAGGHPEPPAPPAAAALILRSDDDVDHATAWNVIRTMTRDTDYRAAVLAVVGDTIPLA
eukprot:TRINITY_DN32158_c0_g1_i1.p1 TRINITY_DN32158_c0_g1~~TRINITY_DN32158_c0_g1_i1.p1  ORF type:complete len:466 (+),score=166.14 TRINITY_DN32158_c0_g1_i1:52-1449(+)